MKPTGECQRSVVTLREATLDDGLVLEQMLYEAFFWGAEPGRPPLTEMRKRPVFSQLLAAWGRSGDVALIAALGGEAAGAAWFRLWTAEAHSYGFVNEHTPELGIAVASRFRGRGIGRLLLRALIGRAQQLSLPGLSLSVAPANPARQLYESEGFRKVGEVGSSWTLLRDLSPPP